MKETLLFYFKFKNIFWLGFLVSKPANKYSDEILESLLVIDLSLSG
jgi:hypothetical protein